VSNRFDQTIPDYDGPVGNDLSRFDDNFASNQRMDTQWRRSIAGRQNLGRLCAQAKQKRNLAKSNDLAHSRGTISETLPCYKP
jgi:hypothetical protein